jgi:hypothetical protein
MVGLVIEHGRLRPGEVGTLEDAPLEPDFLPEQVADVLIGRRRRDDDTGVAGIKPPVDGHRRRKRLADVMPRQDQDLMRRPGQSLEDLDLLGPKPDAQDFLGISDRIMAVSPAKEFLEFPALAVR